MPKIVSESIIKNKYLIYIILITAISGIFWSSVIPLFQAPDEHRHYAVIQHYAEPREYQVPYGPKGSMDLFDVSTQNISPALRQTVRAVEYEKCCFDSNGKYIFNNFSDYGPEEGVIRSSNLNRFVEKYPPYNIKYSPVYYKAGSIIENILANKGVNIIERAFTVRIFSVLIGIIFIIITYLTLKELFFSSLESLLLSLTISFQPMLRFIISVINIDCLLFLSFGIFILGSVKLIKEKLNYKNGSLIILGTSLSIWTKPPGYFTLTALGVLLIIYLILHYKEKLTLKSILKNKTNLAILSVLILALGTFLTFSSHIAHSFFPKLKPLSVVKEYLLYHLTLQTSIERSLTYWGNFGCPNVPISKYYIFIIWIALLLSAVGFISYLINGISEWKKANRQNKTFFCQILFLLYMMLGFGFMIHFINFQQSDPINFASLTASVGIIGRYFFPVILAKFIIITVGFSYLFKRISRVKIIFWIFIAMLALNSITLFDYIIPRYYL